MNPDIIRAFCAKPIVRRRIREYLGIDQEGHFSCVYVADPDSEWPRLDNIRAPEHVDGILDEGRDVSRSLWDRDWLIAHLDVDYVNFEFPDEAYIHPGRSFEIQHSVCTVVEDVLSSHGIQSLHMVSGRGHHYSWGIRRDSVTFDALAELGRCNDTLLGRCRCPGLPFGGPVPEELARAFSGLGLVMEYLAGRIKREAAPMSRAPIELTAVAVGPGERGHEMISVDISEYGDPLYIRVIRVPFTPYLKVAAKQALPPEAEQSRRMIATLTTEDIPLEDAVEAMRNPELAEHLATRCSARIPDSSEATLALLQSYRISPLKGFHDDFYSQAQHDPSEWPSTYDCLPRDLFPSCINHILDEPNDLLMKPAGIELVVRALMALGWHPRHIAGLIRSRYERDYGWGHQWLLHDAATRADFYTRIFAGLFVTQVDDLVDFNCCSIREKGFCFSPHEGCNVVALRDSLLERRRHDRLADRPLNGLFLPHEHL